MSGMSVFSKIKHRGMTHSNFLLTVTVQSLTVEGIVLPDFLFLKWGTTRQKGVLKTALIHGKKATWDETFTLSVTFYNYPGNPNMEKKYLNMRIVHRSAKVFGTVDIELTQFANIDGERTKIFPVSVENSTGTAQLQVTVKTLWINDGDNMPHRPRSITNMSNLSLTSVSEASEKADEDSYDWTDEGSDFGDDKKVVDSEALSWLTPHHANKERAEQLMLAVGMHLTAEDILFLLNQMTPKEQDKVTMAVRARSEMPHPKLKEKSQNDIPNDLLYAIMNKADVGIFLSDKMRHNPTAVEGYLNQLCSLVLFCKNDFPRLESFLLQTCTLSIHFALQVYWFFVAALGRKMELDENLQQQAMRLKIAVINAVEGTEGGSSTSENFVLFQEEIAFTDHLIRIGKELVNLSPAQRKPTLHEHLTKLNETFFGENQKKKRVYIPLCNSHDPRKYVIRFVPDHCTVFGTAHRAPYLVFCEAFEETVAHPFPKIVISEIEEAPQAPPSPSTTDAKKAQKLEAKRLKEEKKRQKRAEAEHGSSFEAAMALGEELVSPRHKDKGEKEKEKEKEKDEVKGKEIEDGKDGASTVTDEETLSLKEMALGKLLWSRKVNAIRSASPHGSDPRWCLVSAIVKSGDDLRQEKLAVQLIEQIYNIFLEFKLPLFIHPYKVLATSSEDGMIETVTNAMTLDSIKQLLKPNATLLDYFRLLYGSETSREFKKARENFVVSMAGYSLVCYMLQIKDRHNGNIMLDAEGHIIHIDFGFILSKKQIRLLNVNFEAAPFKLTQEFIEVMGGLKSSSFKYYKYLMQKGYRKLRKRHYKLTMLVDIVASTTDLPCLTDRTTAELESRFNLYMSKKQSNKFISSLIKEAMRSTTSRAYDFFNQKRFGIRA